MATIEHSKFSCEIAISVTITLPLFRNYLKVASYFLKLLLGLLRTKRNIYSLQKSVQYDFSNRSNR
jgi:hypothetical protein